LQCGLENQPTMEQFGELTSKLSYRLCGQHILFDARRAAFWEDRKTLILSDMQLNSEVDVARLSELIKEYRPKKLLVLDDQVFDFEVPTEFVDDLTLRKTSKSVLEAPFAFLSTPKKTTALCSWLGKFHPMANLSSDSEDVHLPCFHLSSSSIKMPSFCESAAGSSAEPAHGDVLVLIGENCLFAFTAERSPQ
jgi:hypothetical protein